MAKIAKATFKFVITGNGRNETLVSQPLTQNQDFSIITDGAVSLDSPAMMTQIALQPGWNQVVDPAAYLQLPMKRNYFGLFFAQNALVYPWTIAGSTLDEGVGLNAGQPLVLALPPGPTPIFINNWGPTQMVCDSWNW